jgi:transposase
VPTRIVADACSFGGGKTFFTQPGPKGDTDGSLRQALRLAREQNNSVFRAQGRLDALDQPLPHVRHGPAEQEEDADDRQIGLHRRRQRRRGYAGQSRIVNRMKAALIRLGIRGFNPKLKKAAERLDGLRTPEGEPIPPNTLAELRRDMVRRRLVSDQIRQIEDARLERLKQAPSDGPHAMVCLLARVIGVGVETADMLVQEVLSRSMRDRRAVARYAGLTGSPDESGRKRREKGLTRSGNARVRRGMIQLAWRFLMFQKDSTLAQWFRARTESARGTRKTMIVALARKLLIALWRLVREGVVPDGVVLRPA